MTEAVKTVLLNYALCAVAGGVLEYLAPDRAKNALRGVIVAVILLCVFTPLSQNQVSLDALTAEAETEGNLSYQSLLHSASLTEKALRAEFKEILISQGVNEYEIYIETSVDEAENTVYLDSIEILVGKAFEKKIEAIKNQVDDEYKGVLKIDVKNE